MHPREISFTAARRAAITTTRNGAATASLPAAADRRPHHGTLHDLGRRRVTIDRDRHRDHKTKARQAFPAAGRGITTRKAPADDHRLRPHRRLNPAPASTRRQHAPAGPWNRPPPRSDIRASAHAPRTRSPSVANPAAPANAAQTRNRSSTWH